MVRYRLGEPVDAKKAHKNSGSKPEWMFFWLVVGLVVFGSSAVIASRHTLLGWEASLFHSINDLSLGSTFVTVAKLVTNALGAAYPIVFFLLVFLIAKKYKLAWKFLVTVGGAGIMAEIVKRLVKEPRPAAMLHSHNLHQRVVETGYGFPSAHTTLATAMAITLWFVMPAKWRFVSVVWILLVAWSRLFLGVHSPVDVIGGFGCGLIAVCIVRLLPRSIAKPLRLDD